MKTVTININGKETEITLTKEQLEQINKSSNPMLEVYKYHNTTEEEFEQKFKNFPECLKANQQEVMIVAFYNKGVYIVNLSDATPTLNQCYSTSQAWQGIYISDTADSSGKISAIVASQNQTIYSTDITATPIVWNVSSTTSIVQAAISGSNAIMRKNTEGYLYYSSDYGSTWTST